MADNTNPYDTSPPNEPTAQPPVNPPAAEPAVPPVQNAGQQDIEMNKDARTFGMLCHLCALASYVIPFGNIIGPLIIWLIKKNDFPFVDEQGKESLNFQITVMIACLICIPLIFIIIGFPLLIALGIVDLVFVIIAAVKTNAGEHYRYPISIRFIK